MVLSSLWTAPNWGVCQRKTWTTTWSCYSVLCNDDPTRQLVWSLPQSLPRRELEMLCGVRPGSVFQHVTMWHTHITIIYYHIYTHDISWQWNETYVTWFCSNRFLGCCQVRRFEDKMDFKGLSNHAIVLRMESPPTTKKVPLVFPAWVVMDQASEDQNIFRSCQLLIDRMGWGCQTVSEPHMFSNYHGNEMS